MRAEPGILVLVQVGAVEERERKRIARKMRGHPVDDNADAALMQVIDEKLEILRRAVTVRGRKVAGHLITPGAKIRILGDRHHFHMGKTHVDHVVGQRGGEFAISERPVFFLQFPPP